ncbi:MAG: FAD/NAD(P)-binding protein [Phycisphaerae bacterium]|nr:FAD/NAD(P)-binding protein [Phycisphaerae bacterium]
MNILVDERKAQGAARRVAIIGGGFGGVMVAANLTRGEFAGEIDIFETAPLGGGVAYADTGEWQLNVRADRMGAFADQIDGFYRWLVRNGHEYEASDYAPRALYGRYLAEIATDTLRGGGEADGVVRHRPSRVQSVRVAGSGGGYLVEAEGAAAQRYDAVVLCVGLGPPRELAELSAVHGDRRVLDSPWRVSRYDAIRRRDPVVIVGSGLTALDAVAELERRGHLGAVTLISRRGITSRPQVSPLPVALPVTAFADLLKPGTTLKKLVRLVRAMIAHEHARGGDWRSVIDGLRPITAQLWRRLDERERARFVARLALWWDVHRHRAPPAVHAALERGLSSGRVEVLAGRIVGAKGDDTALTLTLAQRGRSALIHRRASWVINCTGPSPDPRTWGNPLLSDLLMRGLLQVDSLPLGVRTDQHGRPLGADGEPAPSLFVLGSLRRADLWESIAVPELREQAASVADCLIALDAAPAKR